MSCLGNTRSAYLLCFSLSWRQHRLPSISLAKEGTIAATESEAERQLLVLEIVFSSVQLIATSLHFTMTVLLGVTNKYNTSIFPLAFSIVALVFVFRKDEKVNDPQITNTSPTGPIASLNSVENQQVPDGSHVRRRQLNGLQNIENLNDLRRFAST